MDIADFKEIINEAKELGVKSVMLNGGEPMENPYFIDMVAYCNEQEIQCTTFSSGYLIDDYFCNEIKKFNLNFLVSLNGSTREVDEKSRDGYSASLKAMNCFSFNNIEYGINWVARNDNVKNLEQLINFSLERGAQYINVVCNKLSSKDKINSACNKDDYIWMKKIIDKYSQFIKIQGCYDLLLSYLEGGMNRNQLYGCAAGIYLMAVDVHKRYMPCTHLVYSEEAKSIQDYWEKSKILNELRMGITEGKCKECGRCRVCRAISTETYENFKASYEECPIYETREVK